MEYIKAEIISLKNHQTYNEKWLQAKIEEDPSILNLGKEVRFIKSEKQQISGGRLDTILYDQELAKRYEVEIQLGKTDESHIIRTIEYWDIERKRNPQYNHCAVIIAEDITSRFLNVISLFNGFIPLIAIQVKAIKIGDNISLIFTKVLDELQLELDDEYEELEPTDRAYWEKNSNIQMLEFTDGIMNKLGDLVADYKLKYNKHYIGIAKDNISKNFISFQPKKNKVILSIKLPKNSETDDLLTNSDFEILTFNNRANLYRLGLKESDLKIDDNINLLKQIVADAKKYYLD